MNATTVWVSDNDGGKIYAYSRDGSRVTGSDFDTLDDAGNDAPTGIASDGETMFVVDGTDRKVYAYRMSDKSRDPSKDFNLHANNGNPFGLAWGGFDVFLVVDALDGRVYIYTRLVAAVPNLTHTATLLPEVRHGETGAGAITLDWDAAAGSVDGYRITVIEDLPGTGRFPKSTHFEVGADLTSYVVGRSARWGFYDSDGLLPQYCPRSSGRAFVFGTHERPGEIYEIFCQDTDLRAYEPYIVGVDDYGYQRSYEFRVRAFNSFGNGDYTVVTAIGPTDPPAASALPAAPVNVQAHTYGGRSQDRCFRVSEIGGSDTAVGALTACANAGYRAVTLDSTRIALHWDQPDDPSILHYQMQWKRDGGPWIPVVGHSGPAPNYGYLSQSYYDTGLWNPFTYWDVNPEGITTDETNKSLSYRVRAVNAAGSGPWSDTVEYPE